MWKDGFLHLLKREIEPSGRIRGDNKDTEAWAIIPVTIRDLPCNIKRNGMAFFRQYSLITCYGL